MHKRCCAAVFTLCIGTILFGQTTADFRYRVDNETVAITYYAGTETDVTIPDRIDNLPVTAIAPGAFRYKRLTGIIIPPSVTLIGDWAFEFNQLAGVTIPHGVTAVGNAAFWGNRLTRLSLPDSVTAVGDYAFYQNPLAGVTIGANVEAADHAFPGNFRDVYTREGRRAGTYASGDGGKTWSRR
jgi:hypothetical protein